MNTTYDALVVGAGISGVRSALDLAQTGQKVALTDTRPAIGGLLAQLDHQFPTDQCGMCKSLPLTQRDASSQFCMRKGLFHRNIDLLLSTDLESLEGEPGAFHAVLRTRSGYVDPTRCIGCGLCAQACPVRVKDEFNAGLGERTAVYLPAPQAIPNHYGVDLDNCTLCGACEQACPTCALDFKRDERKAFSILAAAGPDGPGEQEHRLLALLQEEGFPVEVVHSGEELTDRAASAASDAEEGQAGLRMAVICQSMQDMAPERAVARLRDSLPRLPILAVLDNGAAHTLNQTPHVDLISPDMADREFQTWFIKRFMREVSDGIHEIDAAAVVLAAGFSCYDPSPARDVLGYGLYPDVVTSLEFERLLSACGPTGGLLLRRSDGEPVRKIGWLQCVGSRDLKKDADFCSSICCMISIKQANLARRKAGAGGAGFETVIFHMDMRAFGKDHEEYRRTAREENHVRFIRSRVHSITPHHGPEKGLSVDYLDAEGNMRTERFDLFVLAVGARPPAEMERLAMVTGIELNEWGFPKTMPFEPARTTRPGVFAAGSFAGPRDICESMMLSSAAALGASRLINIYAPIREKKPEPEPEYDDCSRENSRILVALCSSCPVLERRLDVESLSQELRAMHGVDEVISVERVCTGPGWESIVQRAAASRPNRVLIGACTPYAYVPRLHELGCKLRLDPSLMDVADIYASLVSGRAPDEVHDSVLTSLRMAARKLALAEAPPAGKEMSIHQSALVVGGGLAGMTAALGVADHGYTVALAEEAEELGGAAMNVRRSLNGEDPQKFMAELIDQVRKHPNIRVFTDSRVSLCAGRSGQFISFINGPDSTMQLLHGAAILATGGKQAGVYEWGFRVHKSVMTQQEMEQKLASGELDANSLKCVAMIQCWRSREEGRNYCSRVCCQNAVKNILELKRRNPDTAVYVFYRDIMTYGFAESMYTECRRLGATFIRFDLKNRPEVEFEDGKPVITAYDGVLGRDVQVRADVLALAAGVEPNDTEEIAELFNVETDAYGFFKEAEPKWRPVDFMRHGVFMCGLARAPGNMEETIVSAKAAAQRALTVLSEKRTAPHAVVAEVRHTLCSLCGRCIEVCPYNARSMDEGLERVEVDPVLCQGCGACAAVCPNGASVLRGFSDKQVMRVIDAALAPRTTAQPNPEPADA